MASQQNIKRWWKESIVYQIYPASFKDSNGDGWGDINGITSKLDYIKDLGVDVVWTSPIYKSPMVDMGYDISDYKDIDLKYGTLEDVDNLIKELRKRDMKLMMDLVVNHTSDQHDWFKESRSSLDNPKRDWYIWKKPRYDDQGNRNPPNNWAMILGEANSAWTWDEMTEEYYLTLFTPEQADLNWENPDVRAAVHDVLKFWLDRGASGFRMDVINLISKDQNFPDAEVTLKSHKFQSGGKHYANGPRLHEYLQELRREVLDKYDTITVGEMPFVRDSEEILQVVHAERGELNMIFPFDLVDIDNVPGEFKFEVGKWTPKDLAKILQKFQDFVERKGWNSVFCENHDNPRSVTRYTSDTDDERVPGAKLLALMNTTLCGTLYIYQGQELGLRNVPESWSADQYIDVEAMNYWKKVNTMYAGDETKIAEGKRNLRRKARDNARTPMQWDKTDNAGFCPAGVKPWMRVNEDYKHVNAAEQRAKSKNGRESVYQFWQRCIRLRKEHLDLIVYGGLEILPFTDERVIAYRRYNESKECLVILNFSGEELTWPVPEAGKGIKWAIDTYGGETGQAKADELPLKPWQGIFAIRDEK